MKNDHFNYAAASGMGLLLLISSGMFFACGKTEYTEEFASEKAQALYDAAMEEAETTPYGKYPELITYSLGKLTGANNSNMPEGDTYEDNAYTRLLKEMLNVQNEDVFEEMDEQYSSHVSMVIASGELPDLMVVSSVKDLELLVEYDLVEDLSESFETCLSDRIKDIYASYGSGILDTVTFEGKIMAIPETNIEDGPNLLWLRKDWMDELNLKEPKTLADAEEIIRRFIEEDPGNNGAGNTVGLVCDPSLCGECGYSSEYLLDIVFAAYGAYPKQWIYNENGDVVYGSVQPEAEEALAHIREMYESGILDQNFLLRTSSNMIELVAGGQCGSFFGPWWAPNNPLMQALEENPEAEWQPYLLETNEDGTTSYYSKNPAYKFVVVRKGYEHPEIACKMVSVLFDYIRYEQDDNEELKKYYQNNVDPTARPLAINVDYNDALFQCFDELSAVLNGQADQGELHLLENSYYETCRAYLDAGGAYTKEEWAAYTSRITACALMTDEKLRRIPSLFFHETATMSNEWWQLEDAENQTYLKIVTGELGLDAFDAFVEDWYEGGGRVITEEVRKRLTGGR